MNHDDPMYALTDTMRDTYPKYVAPLPGHEWRDGCICIVSDSPNHARGINAQMGTLWQSDCYNIDLVQKYACHLKQISPLHAAALIAKANGA